jgi:hypothetical protein
MLSGCSRKVVPTVHNHFRKDSVIERERLVPITVRETTVRAAFTKDQLDSLTEALRSMPQVSRHIYLTDPALKTQLAFTLDSLGRLSIRCTTLEQTFWEKLKEKDRIIYERDQQIIKERKTFGQKLSAFMDKLYWIGIISVVLTAVFLILTIMGKFKKLTA